MGQDERTSIWDDEDELRRMILEAEDNEVWRIEAAEDDEENDGGAFPDPAFLTLRAKLNSGGADEGESIQE